MNWLRISCSVGATCFPRTRFGLTHSFTARTTLFHTYRVITCSGETGDPPSAAFAAEGTVNFPQSPLAYREPVPARGKTPGCSCGMHRSLGRRGDAQRQAANVLPRERQGWGVWGFSHAGGVICLSQAIIRHHLSPESRPSVGTYPVVSVESSISQRDESGSERTQFLTHSQ